MKPKNSKERQSSFLKFIALFILVVTVLLVAVFFNFRIPQQENVLLKASLDELKADQKYQKEFASEVSEVLGLLDSLDVNGGNKKFLNEVLVLRLVKVQESIANGDASDDSKDMYFNIINSYEDLRKAKEELEKLKDSKKKIEEYQEELKELSDDYKDLSRQYEILRRTSN